MVAPVISQIFWVIWNRTVNRDIGLVESYALNAPDPTKIPEVILAFCHGEYDDRFRLLILSPDESFRVASIGFSLFERAWTLRGMTNLLMDMADSPDFVDALPLLRMSRPPMFRLRMYWL